jgi:hypothetical protein
MGFKMHTPSDYLFLTLYSYFIISLSFLLFIILLYQLTFYTFFPTFYHFTLPTNSQLTFYTFVFMFIKLLNDYLNGWLESVKMTKFPTEKMTSYF